MAEVSEEPQSLVELTSVLARVLRLSHFTIEAAPDLIVWLSANGRIKRVNRAAISTLGRTAAELRDSAFVDLLAERDHGLWQERLQQVLADGRGTAPFECTLTNADGSGFVCELALHRVELEGEAFQCAFIRDIGERKRVEQALRDTLSELQELQERLRAENVYLQGELERHHFDEIVGQSEVIRNTLAQVAQVAPSDASVLIQGESGTGKELLARAVHRLSARAERPMVSVNCAALPSELIESELFGHEKGAFTHAVARRIGRFELADHGTLFLDEIGELPPGVQAKLLRVLQEGEFERLGSTQTQRVDVRIIAATNQDLAEAVGERRFRADLYYRLNVFPITSPPLRSRTEDIPLLAERFLHKFAAAMGKNIPSLSRAMRDSLVGYPWPGNVRELENVIERAVILHQGEGFLDQPLDVAPVEKASPRPTRTLREMEIELINEALHACDWVVGGKHGAARRLEIPASTLRERIARYGIPMRRSRQR